jgi:omega-6 fatty acid desaturase (delta-12 desaturase)
MNDLVGAISGVITMTPYEFWRSSHAKHHATSGDLDFRGYGDVWTMTVKEYLAASPLKRLQYRVYRFPLVTFILGPLPMFAILQRSFFMWNRAEHDRERRSLLFTDIMLLLIVTVVSLLIGFDNFLKLWIPASLVGSSAGVFLFYVQHQFEDTYWRYHPEWDYTAAALQGSSYFKLPKPLQWISGNIGLHHIHHLSPKIPNYLLQKAFDENPEFRNSPTLTLKTAFQVVTNGLAVWDVEQDRLINFKETHDRYLGGNPNGTPVAQAQVAPETQGADK